MFSLHIVNKQLTCQQKSKQTADIFKNCKSADFFQAGHGPRADEQLEALLEQLGVKDLVCHDDSSG